MKNDDDATEDLIRLSEQREEKMRAQLERLGSMLGEIACLRAARGVGVRIGELADEVDDFVLDMWPEPPDEPAA